MKSKILNSDKNRFPFPAFHQEAPLTVLVNHTTNTDWVATLLKQSKGPGTQRWFRHSPSPTHEVTRWPRGTSGGMPTVQEMKRRACFPLLIWGKGGNRGGPCLSLLGPL